MKYVLYLKGSPWLHVNKNEIPSHKILSLKDLMLMVKGMIAVSAVLMNIQRSSLETNHFGKLVYWLRKTWMNCWEAFRVFTANINWYSEWRPNWLIMSITMYSLILSTNVTTHFHCVDGLGRNFDTRRAIINDHIYIQSTYAMYPGFIYLDCCL